MIRTYSELSQLRTFDERYAYLQLGGKVGADTFGFDRYLNQMFYKSDEWQSVRDYVISRDLGCDLGIPGFEISAGKYKEIAMIFDGTTRYWAMPSEELSL